MPKLSDALCAAINEQIKNELASAYDYLNLSARCSARTLKGAANWLKKQWEEEIGHALKLMDYIVERGNEVDLKALPRPDLEFQSLRQVFDGVLEHEREVTRAIHTLYEKATAEKDFAAQTFLQWFVTEQVEEENSAQEVVDLLEIAGDKGTALLLVDRRLAERA